jgi:2-(acetamidomethylene)succinate hydrolase
MPSDRAERRRRRGSGVWLSTLERGSGPLLVLLHGITANARVWDPVAEALAGRYRVVAVDQRGHGLSETPAGGYGADEFAHDVQALVEDLDDGPVVVMGHSMGARNALVAASRYPGTVVACVAIEFTPGIETPVFDALDQRIATGARRFADLEEVRAYLSARYPTIGPEAVARRMTGGFRTAPGGGVEPLASGPAMVAASRGLRDPFEADVLAIKVPTLVIRGGASAVVSPAAFATLRGMRPDFTFVELPGVSHYLPEEAPGWTVSQFEAFEAAGHLGAGRKGTAA